MRGSWPNDSSGALSASSGSACNSVRARSASASTMPRSSAWASRCSSASITGPYGGPLPFPARAEEHGRAVRGGVARELRDEAGLARARFAADEHGVATAVAAPRENASAS